MYSHLQCYNRTQLGTIEIAFFNDGTIRTLALAVFYVRRDLLFLETRRQSFRTICLHCFF